MKLMFANLCVSKIKDSLMLRSLIGLNSVVWPANIENECVTITDQSAIIAVAFSCVPIRMNFPYLSTLNYTNLNVATKFYIQSQI